MNDNEVRPSATVAPAPAAKQRWTTPSVLFLDLEHETKGATPAVSDDGYYGS